MMAGGIESPRLVKRSLNVAAAPVEVWQAIVDLELGARWMGICIVCNWEIGGAVTLTDTPLGPDYPVVEALAEHSDFFWRVGLGQLKKLVSGGT
jgi:hypothetical protein